jgi:hypothetical protein
MNLSITIHPSWQGVPVALSRVLLALAALEEPRQPGDDGEDLAELLEGIDAPELPSAAARPSPAPALAVRHVAQGTGPHPPAPASAEAAPAGDWDGVPRTGRSLYRWGCDHKCLPDVNRIGKVHGYPRRVTDWEPSQVAAAYAVLTTEPAQNGRPH